MRCVRSPYNRMLNVDLRGIVLPLTRIVDSVLLHEPAGITHELSASAAESLAICRVVTRDRSPPYLLNQRDGTSNLTTGLHATATAVRETLSRSGHHPHRSMRTSSGPFVIFIHHIDLVNSVTGYRYHTDSSTIEYMYINMSVLHGSAGWGTTGGAFTGHRGTPVIC